MHARRRTICLLPWMLTSAAVRSVPAAGAAAADHAAAAPGAAGLGPAGPGRPRALVAAQGHTAISIAVDAVAGGGPAFLRSYPTAGPEAPALTQAAFTYDNALAVMALLAVGDVARARRVADALAAAVRKDRSYADGRVRNAYRAGPVGDGAPALPGWWDAAAGRWLEDRYQAGTATGNAAWAALALLAAHDATRDGGAGYQDAAQRLLRWMAGATVDRTAPAGVFGGFFGHEPTPERQGWKSTEHNLDVHAAATWLARGRPEPGTTELAAMTRGFVAAMWDEADGRMLIGTGPDGHTPNADGTGLDAQLWPVLAVADAPAAWRRAVTGARQRYGVGGGLGFRVPPEGIWTEGTAQAALSLQAIGDEAAAEALFPVLLAQAGPGGMLYATPEARLRTGLAIGPDSVTDDFAYFHLPHLGATAWAVLAATRWNPFTGRTLDAAARR